MRTTILPRLAARTIGALLALSMLIAPTVAQVTAAETCRLRCERAGAAAKSACCCKVEAAQASSVSDQHRATAPVDRDGGRDTGAKYCPGCGARPLIVASTPVTLTLDASPVFSAAPMPTITHSADISFAIFHPPRA